MLRFVPMLIALTFAGVANAQTDTKYVSADVLNVRLCPVSSCAVTNKIYAGQSVQVFEQKDGFSRISKFYDGAVEGHNDSRVARWVSSAYLSDAQSAARPIVAPAEKYMDRRIRGIPQPGEYGLTEAEVLLMRRYAYGMISTGKCESIEYADKSTSNANTYYVNCAGEARNRFFKVKDIDPSW